MTKTPMRLSVTSEPSVEGGGGQRLCPQGQVGSNDQNDYIFLEYFSMTNLVSKNSSFNELREPYNT